MGTSAGRGRTASDHWQRGWHPVILVRINHILLHLSARSFLLGIGGFLGGLSRPMPTVAATFVDHSSPQVRRGSTCFGSGFGSDDYIVGLIPQFASDPRLF